MHTVESNYYMPVGGGGGPLGHIGNYKIVAINSTKSTIVLVLVL